MKALAVNAQSPNHFSYHLGYLRTHIKVRDFRKRPFAAAWCVDPGANPERTWCEPG
jgi:hypothetical protein